MSFAYSVAIKLSVANLASQGIKLIAADLLAAHGHATNLQQKLSALKLTAVGFGTEKMGSGILGFLQKSVDVSKEYTRQLSLMNAAGMTQKDIAEATAAAWNTSKNVITSSAAENLSAIRELRSVFGNDHMHEAYAILPTVQRTKAIMEALSGQKQDHVGFDMVKAIELRNTGAMTPAAMQRNADMMSQTLMAFGGTLNVHDYHMAIKQAKTSGMRLDDEFVYKYLPTLMQEVKTGSGGAQTAGTILETMRRSVAGGRIPEKLINNWVDSGMLGANGIGSGGAGNRFIKPGSIAGTETFLSNPYKWATEFMGPAIEKLMSKRGVGFDTATSMLMGDRNAEFGLSTFIKKALQFERDKKLVESGNNSITTYNKLLGTNPQLASMALDKQWENIHARIGYEILPRLIPYMVKFADLLDRLSGWMQRHPNMTTKIVEGLAALAVTLKILGGALLTYGIVKFLGMGSLIGGAGKALGGLASGIIGFCSTVLTNPLVLQLMAAGAGLSAGYYGAKSLGADKLGEWIGGKAADMFLDDPLAPKKKRGDFVPKGYKRPYEEKGGNIYMDGKKVGEIVSNHQAKDLNRPATGARAFDPNMSLRALGAH